MQQIADLFVLLHDGDERRGKVLGVRGHKAHAELALDGRDHVEKRRKIDFPVAIGIDVLPEQSYFLIPSRNQCAYFLQNDGSRTALLSAAHIGHDAICAKIIATVSDVHPGIGITCAIGLRPILRLSAILQKRDDLFFMPFARDE